jgi:hypothetical protein
VYEVVDGSAEHADFPSAAAAAAAAEAQPFALPAWLRSGDGAAMRPAISLASALYIAHWRQSELSILAQRVAALTDLAAGAPGAGPPALSLSRAVALAAACVDFHITVADARAAALARAAAPPLVPMSKLPPSPMSLAGGSGGGGPPVVARVLPDLHADVVEYLHTSHGLAALPLLHAQTPPSLPLQPPVPARSSALRSGAASPVMGSCAAAHSLRTGVAPASVITPGGTTTPARAAGRGGVAGSPIPSSRVPTPTSAAASAGGGASSASPLGRGDALLLALAHRLAAPALPDTGEGRRGAQPLASP